METFKTEDGHTNALCPICDVSEHIDILEKDGKCQLCKLENRSE